MVRENPSQQVSRYQEAKAVCVTLVNAGYPTMFAGGCVRDRLFGLAPKDYDLATSAVPLTAKGILEDAGYKILELGLSHGTIGVLTKSQTVEVTTLRTDLECDGRHAKVGFTQNFHDDANRRDFTINGIFEDIHGQIHDFVGGYRDLMRRQLRFIGDPSARIQEDYLRILRYFRFLARLGWPPDKHALTAIERERAGMHRLAFERILRELDQIFCEPFTAKALEKADQTGCLQTLFSWYHSHGLEHFCDTSRILRFTNPNHAWFFFLWHCGPQEEGPWLKQAMARLRFSKTRQFFIQQLYQLYLRGSQPIEGYTTLLKLTKHASVDFSELKTILQCSPGLWKPGLVARYQAFLDRLQGPPPELLRKDILNLPIEERSEAILVAKIFWYLGWCGGKTPVRTVLLHAKEFKPWLESEALVPPPLAKWGEF